MLAYKKIKKKDTIKILTGKDSGKIGNILEVDKKKGKVLIEGLNLVKKAMRKTKKDQKGGIRDIESYIDVSNIILVCPKCKKPTRVGYRMDENKKKHRVCKKCKADIE